MKFSDRDLQDLLAVVDSRIDKALSRRPRIEYGSVDSVADGKASVNLLGASMASGGFTYPSHLNPVAGDFVRVAIHPSGDRYIEEAFAGDITTSNPAWPVSGLSAASDGPTTYPMGVSVMEGSDGLSKGWPNDFITVVTFKGQFSSRIFQMIHRHQVSGSGNVTMWQRSGHTSAPYQPTGWSAFRSMLVA